LRINENRSCTASKFAALKAAKNLIQKENSMQALSFQQETSRRVWRHIRLATPIIVLVALLSAGSNLTLAQGGVVKPIPIRRFGNEACRVQTGAGTTCSAAFADTRSIAKASPETQTVIVPDLIDLDVTDAEQAVHSVGLYLDVTGIGDVVHQAPRAGTAVPIGSLVYVSLKNY
jgi:hypothetical protein